MSESAVPQTTESACKAHYVHLQGACATVLDQSFNGAAREAVMAKSHAFVADLRAWGGELGTRPEADVLRAAQREYEFALLALVLGQYRAAFAALRLSIEMSFAAVQWSANERELREWKRGERDCVWAKLIDKETGVLSKQFLKLFSENFADEAASYRGTAEGAYRECSEYVHGNAQTHTSLPDGIAFHEPAFLKWHEKADSMRLSIAFCLAARYLTELTREAQGRLQDVVLDHLGHSGAVQALFAEPAESPNA